MLECGVQSLCVKLHMLANRLELGSFPFNYSVKRMLQTSESEVVYGVGRVCVRACACVEEKRKMNLSIDVHHLLCLTFLPPLCHMSVTGLFDLLTLRMFHRYLVSMHVCVKS